MSYRVILKSLRAPSGEQYIILSECLTAREARHMQKSWRRVLGGDKWWHVNRRPGIDTLDFLALEMERDE
jgi:hypothetical protein